MKLVYKTNDLARAEEIVGLLQARNIQASIEGKHTFSLGKFIPGGGLSVWVHDNAELERASTILSEFYQAEAPQNPGVGRFNPMSGRAIKWFVILWIAITVIVAVGVSAIAD